MTEPAIRTLADLPFHVSGRFSRPVLMGRCEGDRIREWSSRQLFDEVRDLSLGLETLGVRPRDRVAILSDSRPEWVLADLAILTAGAVTVPVYATLPASQVGYVLAHSGARVVLVADEAQAAKVRAARKDAPAVEAVVLFEPGASGAGAADGGAAHRRLPRPGPGRLPPPPRRGRPRPGRRLPVRSRRGRANTPWPRSSSAGAAG